MPKFVLIGPTLSVAWTASLAPAFAGPPRCIFLVGDCAVGGDDVVPSDSSPDAVALLSELKTMTVDLIEAPVAKCIQVDGNVNHLMEQTPRDLTPAARLPGSRTSNECLRHMNGDFHL